MTENVSYRVGQQVLLATGSGEIWFRVTELPGCSKSMPEAYELRDVANPKNFPTLSSLKKVVKTR